MEKEEKANSIMNNQLNLAPRAESMLSTSISLGENQDPSKLAQEISNYKYGQGNKCNVILAVPEVIENSNGEKIYLGFPERNTNTAAQQYDAHCILDRIVSNLHGIPKEFILGYLSESQNGDKSFTPNEQHISKLSPDKIETLYSTLSSAMNDITKSFNDNIVHGRVDSMKFTRLEWQRRGLPTHLLDNAIHLAEKYGNKPHRKIITQKNPHENEQEHSPTTRRSKIPDIKKAIQDDKFEI